MDSNVSSTQNTNLYQLPRVNYK